MDILRMLEQLNQLVCEQPRKFGPILWGLDQDEVAMQIGKIRASLPDEMKAAAATVRESDRIVDSAREDAAMTVESAKREGERVTLEARQEAERILEHARAQQDRMVGESEILKLAKSQAEEIRNSADRDAVQLRRNAEDYAHSLLSQLEGVVGKAMTAIERGKQELERPEQAVVAAPSPRERVRVS